MKRAHNHTPGRSSLVFVALALALLLPVLAACGGQVSQVFTNINSGLSDSGGGTARQEPARPAAEGDRAPAPQQAVPDTTAGEGAAASDDALLEYEEEAAEDMAMEEANAEAMPAAPAPAPTAPATAAADGVIAMPEDETSESEEPQDIVVPEVEVNPFTLTTVDNLSTFAMDVDTASYSAARNYLTSGSLPPPQSVRVEEFVNYFRYGYPNPQEGAFGIVLDAAPSPSGEPAMQIVRVGIQGRDIEDSQRDDAVLTFVIDISGSMSDSNRLPLVKQALRMLVEQLRESDEVAIVVYSDDTRVVLEHTSVARRSVILAAIDSLQIEGSTNVEAGLNLGYQIASDNFRNGAINRVILCSDGVANVGATTPEAIRESVRDYAAQGVLLTTVGFGMGDFNDHLMEQLANDGNGNYAYVDTRSEAERVFIEDLTGTLQVIAHDAKIQVEFNPEVVSQYRLLGYENRDIADTDFRNDEVDAGEVGAGHSVTALYEMLPTQQGSGTALTVTVRYEDPENGEVAETQQALDSSAVVETFEQAPANMQLAVAVAGLAEYLRNSAYMQSRSLDDVLAIAERVEPQFANDDDVRELVDIIRQAQALGWE